MGTTADSKPIANFFSSKVSLNKKRVEQAEAKAANLLVFVEEGGRLKECHPLLPLLVYPGHNVQTCREQLTRQVTHISLKGKCTASPYRFSFPSPTAPNVTRPSECSL